MQFRDLTHRLVAAIIFTLVTCIVQAQHQIVLVDFGNNSSFRGTNVINPDINGRYWNSVWSGAFYANMPDLANNATPIDLGFDSAGGTDYFNGPSGATQNPAACVIDSAALGNLGVKEAVYDYYVNSKFQIQGLDSGRNYQLSFFGSHKFNAENVTRYGVYTDTNYSTLVASVDLTVGVGSAHNSNTVAILKGLTPQTGNKLFIKFASASGTTNGYLNCMQILSNYRPTATNLNVSHTAGVTVTIAKANLAADVDGDALTFTITNTANGLTLSQDSTNIYVPASFVDDQFSFSVQDNYGGTNAGTVTLLAQSNLGAHPVILVDFGPNDGSNGVVTVNPDYVGQYWNNFVGAGNGVALPAISLVNLITSSNSPTPIGLNSSASGWAANGILNGGLLTPAPALLGNFAVTNATADYFLTTTSASLTFTNLDPAKQYRFRLFGTRQTTTSRTTRYTATGGNGTFTNDLATSGTGIGDGGYNGNNNNVAVIGGVTPNGSKEIQLGVSVAAGGFAYLGVLEMTANRAPTTTNLTVVHRSGSAVTITKASLTGDADGDPLTVSLGTTTNGATLSQDGVNIYVPANTVDDQFTFVVTDDHGSTNTGTVTLVARKNLIEVYGSSVAQGWNGGGSLTNGSYANGYAGLMTTALGNLGWVVINNSTPGDNTSNGLVRFPTNVVMVDPNYLMLGFGLNNEGLESTSDPAGTVNRFLTNLTNLVAQCRSNGIYPVVNSGYPSTNYTASKYAYLKSANLTINTLDLPSVNLLGAVDAGNGRYVPGYNFDAIHPNTAGHQEMFYTIVPTLFDAIAQGKTNRPSLATNNYARLTAAAGVNAPLVFTPSNTIHSFTMAFRVRSTDNGTIAAIGSGSSYATLKITNGQFVYSGTNGNQIIASGVNATNGGWYDLALAHGYARSNTMLIVDGSVAGNLAEQFQPYEFILGGPGASGAPAAPTVLDLQNWCVYRSAWNADEAAAQAQGNQQQASMEIGAMLADASFTSNSPALNLAQSLSVALVNSDGFSPQVLVPAATGLAAQPLAGPEIGASLSWTDNSASESGFLIQRRASGSGLWTDVATVGANTTTYTNSGLASGVVYDYRVLVLEGGGLRGHASNIASAVAGFGSHQVILVDLGPNDLTNGVATLSPDAFGQYWNNLVGSGGGGGLSDLSLTNLVTALNTPTTIGLNSSASGWAANGILNGGLLIPDPALLSNFAVPTATEDYFLTTTSASLTLTNLDPAMQYRLRLFGTRDTTINRTTRYVALGGNGSFTNDLATSGTGIGTGGYNGNNDTLAVINAVAPDVNNEIQIETSVVTGGFAYLGILELTANSLPTANAVTNTVDPFGSVAVVNGPGENQVASDPDGDALTFAILVPPTNGTATATASGVNYTNTLGIAGQFDTLTYTVADAFGGTATNLMSFWVPSPQPPTLLSYSNTTTHAYLTYEGVSGQAYVSERATNLVGAVWVPLATNVANPLVTFTNAFDPNSMANFFRTRPQ